MTKSDVAIPDEATKQVAVVPDKPLTQVQQGNLQKIIYGDFADLRERTAYEIRQQLDARLAEIEKQLADNRKVEAGKKKLTAAHDRAQAILDKADAEVRATGLVLESHGNVLPFFTLSVCTVGLQLDGRAAAVQRAHNAANRVQRTADLVINRREREANRQVLLSGISAPNAADLVNGLPKSADILGEVTAEIAINNEEDLRELHLDTPST